MDDNLNTRLALAALSGLADRILAATLAGSSVSRGAEYVAQAGDGLWPAPGPPGRACVSSRAGTRTIRDSYSENASRSS